MVVTDQPSFAHFFLSPGKRDRSQGIPLCPRGFSPCLLSGKEPAKYRHDASLLFAEEPSMPTALRSSVNISSVANRHHLPAITFHATSLSAHQET
jgi:hypothetical protein